MTQTSPIYYYDTHSHLDMLAQQNDLHSIIAKSLKVGVKHILSPGTKGFPINLERLKKIDSVKFAWGIHPQFIDECKDILFKEEPFCDQEHQASAIGECGLDKRVKTDISLQLEVFEWQTELAKRLNLPLIVHLVGHYEKALKLLKQKNVAYVLHSCSASIEMTERFIMQGAMVSVSPLNISDNHKKLSFIKKIPEKSLLIETDAPSKPNPFIADKNILPSSLPQIIKIVASIRNTGFKEFAKTMYNNSVRFFGE